MASQIDICNMAMSVIGTRSSIASMTEGSAESNQISLQYPTAIDAVLRAAHWNFARKQIAMTLLQDGTQGQPVPSPWLYEYAVPSDCVLARFVMPTIQAAVPSSTPGIPSQVTAMNQPVRFVLSTDLDPTGNPINVILTNQPQATLVYTFRNLNPAMYDARFVEALAAFLGAKICIPLTGDKAMMKMALAMAQQYTMDAQASNGNEGLTVIDHAPDWIRVRGYASDYAYPDGGLFIYGPQALTLLS
ncbi:Phage protein [Collimonas arenae]|uniref:Phage protein n=1 Tax=Collimonas arenae TaxID=279058 RepID=A0A0A1F657_9BURK|nr:hypothetical protein [Collimonas arenae]AIY40188.1 Phage protein [Collimonas arenae]